MKPQNGSIAVLCSGGVESAVLVAESLQRYPQVHPVYIQAGLCWERTERFWLNRFLGALRRDRAPDPNGTQGSLERLTVLQLPVRELYGNHWSITGIGVPGYRSKDRRVYLPGRNLLLLAQGALFCAMGRIPLLAMGLLKANPFPDSSPAFLKAFQAAASEGLAWPIQIITPFGGLAKPAVLDLGRHLPLHLTFSCIRPVRRLHCGNCNKCAERRRAFRQAGLADRTRYHQRG